jgi:hypothetical protein
MPAGFSSSVYSFSQFVPQSIPGCALWLRSDQGIILNGSTVSGWNDFSGNGNNCSQATSADQPTYVSSGGANNLPYLSFTNGGAQSLNGGVVLSAQPCEYFVVARLTTNDPAANAFLFSCGGFRAALLVSAASNNLVCGGSGPTELCTTALTLNADFVADGLFLTAGTPATSLTLNGTTVNTSNTALTGALGDYTVGQETSLTTTGWAGFIYEIVYYNNQISSSARTALLTYFQSRYRIIT